MVWYLRSGSFAIVLPTMYSSRLGACSMQADSGAGASFRTAAAVSMGFSFWNGCLPASISYRTMPKEKMSDR